MITYIIYAFAFTYPWAAMSLFLLYCVFVIAIGVKWKNLNFPVRLMTLSIVITPIIIAGLIYGTLWFEHSSDIIRKSDYMGGCKVEELINGDCIFDSVRREHANYYPPVTGDDGIWERLEGYDKVELLKTAEKELERLQSGKYKGQDEQIARIQSFIDILQRRYGIGIDRNPISGDIEEVAVPIDMTNWKTYRRAKYGFELDYPGDWAVEEYYSPGLWLSLMSPYDVCSETPESCTNFSVRFTPPNQEDGLVQINLETVVRTPGLEVRNNEYIPIHASCMTSVPFPDFTLRDRRLEIIMFVIQDGFPENIDMDEATKICKSGQLENSLFEKMITTLRSI